MVEMLKDELTGWLRRDPARMLREIVDNDRGYGEVLTWSNLPDVLKAQAMFKQARTLWHHLGEPADLAAIDEDTLLEASRCSAKNPPRTASTRRSTVSCSVPASRSS